MIADSDERCVGTSCGFGATVVPCVKCWRCARRITPPAAGTHSVWMTPIAYWSEAKGGYWCDKFMRSDAAAPAPVVEVAHAG